MEHVEAPEGYEASVCWIDGARSWRAFYRQTGETFWTPLDLFGHAETPREERTRRAGAMVAGAVRLRGAA